MFNQPPRQDDYATPQPYGQQPYGQQPYGQQPYHVPAIYARPPIVRYRVFAALCLAVMFVLVAGSLFTLPIADGKVMVAMIAAGVGFQVLACCFLMKSKGQSMAWGLFGVFGLAAFLIMLFVPSKYTHL
jgi:hypothetical protein